MQEVVKHEDDATALGLVLWSAASGAVVVKSTTPGLWADEQGVRKGSRIVRVNGKPARDLTESGLKAQLLLRPLRLTVIPPPWPGVGESAPLLRSLNVLEGEQGATGTDSFGERTPRGALAARVL